MAEPRPGPRPLYMNLMNAYHGALTPVPSHAYVMSVGVHDKAQATQARGVLERTHTVPGVAPRVSVVMGTERMVKALTAYLLAEGVDLAKNPVKTLVLFGGHVTPARQRLLALCGAPRCRTATASPRCSEARWSAARTAPGCSTRTSSPEVVHPARWSR